jgi:hypothetical protein
MFLFGWLVVIVLLVIVAEFLLMGRNSIIGLLTEHRLRRSQPSHRAVAAVTLVLLIGLLAWGLVGRNLIQASG